MYGNEHILSGRDPNGEPTAHDEIVAGGVGFIEVTLDYRTLTEDAVESFLILDLPSTLLEDPQSIKAIIGVRDWPALLVCDHTCMYIQSTRHLQYTCFFNTRWQFYVVFGGTCVCGESWQPSQFSRLGT